MASVLEYGVSGFSEAPYSRAELFDAAAYGADPHALRWLLDHFEIIARPRHRLGVALRISGSTMMAACAKALSPRRRRMSPRRSATPSRWRGRALISK